MAIEGESEKSERYATEALHKGSTVEQESWSYAVN